MNNYDLEINNRAFLAIKENKKKVEIRVNKIKDKFNYGDIKGNDIINFISYDGDKIKCRVIKNNWYKTIEELLTIEGTKYTLSSTDDFNEGIKSINSFPGYKEGIEKSGVYAIHIEVIT